MTHVATEDDVRAAIEAAARRKAERYARPQPNGAPERPAAEPQTDVAFPTLAETWSHALEAYLDPDPFLLRPSHAGMGLDLDHILGGGLSVGQTMAVGAFGAGAGKTAWVHQLVDGIAQHSAAMIDASAISGEAPAVTPVIYVSEMNVRDITLRSLSRQAFVEGFLLRDPRGPKGRQPIAGGAEPTTVGEDARRRAMQAANRFHAAASLITMLDRTVAVNFTMLLGQVERIRQVWEDTGADVPAVVIVLDPIHRLLDSARSEVEGLKEALDLVLNLTQRTKAISIITSDTTKQAAFVRRDAGKSNSNEALADMVEQAFRGSYELLHVPDVSIGVITFTGKEDYLSEEDVARIQAQGNGTLYAEVASSKARWSARGSRAAYWYHAAFFQFRPAEARTMPGEQSLADRVLAFVKANPGSSQRAVRKGVHGSDDRIREAINELLSGCLIVDQGKGQVMNLHPSAGWSGTGGNHFGTTSGNHL